MSYSDNFYKALGEQKKKKKKTDNDIAPVSTGDSFSDNFYAELRKREKEVDALASSRAQDVASFSRQEHEDDIAPVKGGNKDSVFKSGAFSDGVDGVGDFFEDLGQTILGTIGDLGVGITKGAGNLAEGVVDLGTYATAGVADLIGKDDFAKKAKDIAKKNFVNDLLDESQEWVDQYSVLGNTADSVSEGLGQVAGIILTGGLGEAAGLTSAGVSALTTGTLFSSSMGGGMSEAYQGGASDEDAVKYGAAVGATEAVSEMFFGGLGKGVQALGLSKGLTSIDDVFAKKLSNTAAKFITSKAGQNLVGNVLEYAVKSGAEGLEEAISGFGTAIAKDLFLLNGEDEKAFGEILKDENLLEQFVVGSIVSGISQGGDLISSTKSGRDFVSGLSQNEQSVVDKVFEERLAEESKTRKIGNTEKNKLYDQVVEEMKTGRIDTDTIERILGSKTYEGYKNLTEQETSLTDRKKAIEDEIKSLVKTPESQFTVEQRERLNSLREEAKGIKVQIKGLDTKTAKTNLFNEVNKLTEKDTFLRESYNQREKRGQAFTADLNKYKGKQREAIKRAIDSGVLNDTYRSHELVDTLSRLEAEKGIVFDYTNNKKLAQSGMALKGKTINGFEKDGVVTLNVQSSKAWQSTVGHEITHVLEGTEAYSALQEALIKYSQSKGDYQSRYDSLVELYKGVKGYETDFDAKIKKELTADLVGDYLFSDKAFIDRLVGNRTLFQKVWDEVKYLCKVATGKELTEIEKVNREFERAWKELSVNENLDNEATDAEVDDVQYSVSVTDKQTLDSLNDQIAKGEYDAETNPDGGYYVTYKSMSFWGYDEDGNAILRSPMAEYVDGELSNAYLIPKDKSKLNWYQATETIDENTGLPSGLLVKTKQEGKKSFSYLPASENQHLINEDWSNLYFNLRKKIQKNGKWVNSDVPARYNPYEHSSNSMLNDQFTAAYQRDNLVTVKMYVPISEDNGAYRAKWSKDSTGWSDWKSGIVAGKIGKQKDLQRRVYLSRYAAPVEIVPDSEVAQAYKSYLEGTDVAIPDNVVSPNLLSELKKAGVPIEESGKVKYSISEIVDENNKSYGMGVKLDSTLLDDLTPDERVEMVKLRVSELGGQAFTAYDGNGNAVKVMIAKAKEKFKNKNGKIVPVNKDLTTKYIDNETKQEAVVLADELILTAKYEDSKAPVYPHGRLDNNGKNNWEYWTTYIQDKNNTIWQATLNIATTADGEKILYDVSPIKKAGRSVKSDTLPADNSIAPLPENVNTQLSISFDSDYMSAVERGDTETAQLMVDEAAKNAGYSVKAYHGTGRADRVGNVFRTDRATSGPMAFFTDSKDIASNYARDKADTSLAYDEEYDSYYTQFRVNRNGKSVSIPELWKYLSAAERNRIKEQAGHIKFDDDYETIIVDKSAQHGNGAWDAYTLNSHRGNALEALIDTWLESGDLYNQEEMFLEVLKNVGLTDVEYRNPDARYEKVYDTWLKITNPFDTDNADQSFYDGLSEWIDNNDMSVYEKETANADMWDKNNQTPESWLGKLEYDIESGTTHAWTVIPDFVTDYLKSQGFDGIKDKGGKGGGDGHTVWIPFSSEQVKSAEAITRDDNGNVIPLSQRFDPSKTDIRNSLSNEGEEFTPTGNYSTPLRETALEGDIAPVAEGVAENATGTNVGHTTADDTAEDAAPAQTVDEKISAKLKNLQTELDNNLRLRGESNADFDSEIARLRAEYEAKKNKNTKVANDVLRRIERIQRLKGNVDADYQKRITGLQERIQKMNTPQYKRGEQRRAKQEKWSNEIKELIGDTSTWVDKKLGISYQTNTLHRNLRDVVRDANGNRDIAKADAIYEYLQGSYNHNEALLKRESRDIKQPFADMEINKHESEYIQMLGEFKYNPETKLTLEAVDEYYGKHKDNIDLDKVNRAIDEARKVYDDLFKRVNAVLREMGLKEMGYKEGYFPHFTDTKQGWLAKLFNWKTIDTEIPTDIAGMTEEFNPVRTYQSFDKRRKSDETDYNFLKGFDTYVHGALDWIYHIEDIQKRRAFENEIRYSHSEQGIRDKVTEIINNKELDADEVQALLDNVYTEAKNPLNNFVTDLRNSTNNLAGKKSTADRSMEYATNRKVYSTMTNLSNRVSGNMVVGSISSALTNFIPITQSWGQVNPVSSLRAVGDVVRSAFRNDGMVEKSDFMTNRLLNEENLNQTGWDKASNVAGGLMNIFDHFTTEVVWRSKYIENMDSGMSESEAIHDADVFAENVMAGRSRGNMPTIYNSKNPITKMLTAFQLEVGNQYGYMFKDLPQDVGKENIGKLTAGYAKMFIGAYVYNALFSKLTGRDAAFDPIGILEDLLKDLGFGGDDEEEEVDILGAVQGLGENILQEVPYVGGLLGGGRIPISSALPYDSITKMVTGTMTDIAEKDWENLTNEWLNPVYYLALPFGGGQLKKTNEGLGMFSDDHPVSGSYTASGNLRFPVEDTPLNRVQAALFGQYASENAREYFDNDYAPLKEKQIQEYIDVDIPIKDYWEYREGLKKQETLEDKFDYIAGLDLPVEKKNILINNVVDRKDEVDLEGYEDFSSLEEFDFANKYPDRYAVAKSVGGYSSYKTYAEALSDIKADKDANGKTVTGSRKEKVIQYINGLNADYETKIILYKSEYPSDDTYNADIINYVNNRADLTYEERVAILTELGFRVVNGNIYAD